MKMELMTVEKEDLAKFKTDMQEAFQIGAIEGGFPVEEQILPEEDINKSLSKKGAVAYKAVIDGEMVGGGIVVLTEDKGYLDFLYVKCGKQSKGIGKFIWFEIEKTHPEIRVWETCTPYFEKRNIHFYINVCGFAAVKYFKDEPLEDDTDKRDDAGYFDDGMFEFRKEIR